MVEAATEFKKSGYSDDDAAQLALVAQMYRNVADEQLDAGTAANFIVSQMKAFNLTAEDSQHIIDAVNEVSNNYAVSSSDLARNIGNASAAMAAGGNTMEQTLGMMTAMTEITRNGSKASRGLVTIQSRYNQILDESSSTGKKLTDFYTKHGIQLKDETGQLRSMYDVLGDLSSKWGGLTDDEKKYFALIQGGATQTQNLMALMSNFGTAVDATKTAMESSGSAAEENAAAMESLRKKIDNLKAAWENFATGTITKDFIGGIMDAGTRLLEFANTDLGITITKALLFGTTLGSATGFLGTFVSKIGESISTFKKLKSGVDLAADAVGALTKAKWTVIALGIAGITAAIIALVEAAKNAPHTFEEFADAAEGHLDAVDSLKDKAQQAKEKLEELNKIPADARTLDQEAEIARLQALQDEYDRLIAKEELAAQKAAGKSAQFATPVSGKVLIGAVAGGTGEFQGAGGAASYVQSQISGLQARKDVLAALTAEYGSTTEAIYGVSKAMAAAGAMQLGYMNGTEFVEYSVQELQSKLQTLGITFGQEEISIEQATQNMELWTRQIEKGIDVTPKHISQLRNFLDINKQTYEQYKLEEQIYGTLSTEKQNFIDQYEKATKVVQDASSALDLYDKSVETVDKALASFPDHMKNSSSAIETVAKALVNNSELGITSVEGLKTALLNLAAGGAIDLSKIGNIDDFIAKLVEAEGIKFSDKNINVETNAEEAKNQIEAVNDSVEDQSMDVHISTVAEGHELEGALQNIADWIDKINGKTVKVTLEADVSAAKEQINSVTNDINNIVAGVDVTITTNAAEARAQIQDVQSAADALSNVQPKVTVKANTSSALANLRTISNYTIPDKSFSVVCSGASVAIQNIATIKHGLDQLKDKTINVKVNYIETGNVPKATGSDWLQGGNYLINDGAPVNGSRAELVVSDGIGRIYNDGDTTIQNLPQGTKIYTAAETQKLLKDRGLTVDDVAENPIPAMANGTKNNPKYPDRRNDPTYSGVTALSGSGENLKKNFEEWLKEKKHWLNMDVISETQYYRDLEIMNERYLKNLADAKDEYWQHEEEIYKYQNQSLEEQIQLEEKLSDLAKAKENRVLAFAGGRFQYIQNLDAIAKAQREVDQLTGKYANGTTNARGGLSLVGENGPEMRVLGHGDGIIPAEATKNLMALSNLNIKDALSNIGRAIVTNYSFDISRLELPSVSNAGEFLDGLKNLAYQYSYARA